MHAIARKITLHLIENALGILGIVLLVVLIGWWLVDGRTDVQTITVVPGTFIEKASVSGKVVPQDSVDLGFEIGGRIIRVRSDVGDTVEKGEILAEIDPTDASTLIAQRQAQVSNEEATLRVLEEGARPEEIAVSEAAVRSAEVARDQAALALIEKIQDTYRTADDAIRVKADSYLSSPRTQPTLTFISSDLKTRTAVETARLDLEQLLSDWESQVYQLTAQSDIRSALSQAQSNLGVVTAFLINAHSVIVRGVPTGSITSATLATYASDTATARTNVNTAITALTTADTAFKAAEATLETAKRNLVLLRAGASNASLSAQHARVDAARALLNDAQAQLSKTSIRAPFSGTVTRSYAKAGEVVSVHEPVLSLISEGALEIESYVPELYIADVKIGDTATVILDAYGSTMPFSAEVLSIDPAETIRDGVSTYRVLLIFVTDDTRIKPGMTANVTILTAKKDNVLSIPQGLVRNFDGKSFVSVIVQDHVVEREVVTGSVSSDGLVEVISGLATGDEVVVSP